MSDEEKLSELLRVYNLPPSSRDRHAYNVLKELDDSATLTFYRHRSSINQLFLGTLRLCISKWRGEELTERLQLAINCHAPHTFSVSLNLSLKQQEIQRIALEIRERQADNEPEGLPTDWFPSYKIDSGIEIKPNHPLRLSVKYFKKLIQQGLRFLEKAETKTKNTSGISMKIREIENILNLEERALEQVRLKAPNSNPEQIRNDTATLVAIRLRREVHPVPFPIPRLEINQESYFQVLERLRDIIRDAAVSGTSPEKL